MDNAKITNWDEYNIKARYLPTLITVMPFVHFLIIFLGNVFWKELLSEFTWMLVVSDISLSMIFVLALLQVQTEIGKNYIEENVFGIGGKYFPTTDMLLLNGGFFSNERKNALRKNIENIFKITFPKDEDKNPENSRLFAREAVGYVRRYVGKGIMTHQYNIRYGFIRNLIAGFIWGIIGSSGLSIIYGVKHDWKPMSFFITILFIFFFLLLFRKKILKKMAYVYADNLYNEFMLKANSEFGKKEK